MKKIYKSNFLAIAAVAMMAGVWLTSCADLSIDDAGRVIEPLDLKEAIVADPSFFLENANVSALQVYSSDMFGSNQRYAHIFGDDIVTAANIAGGNKQEFLQYDLFSPTSTNGIGNATWARLWKVISNTNDILLEGDAFDEALDNGDIDAKTLKEGRAEASFLRAMAYFELVRGWGRIPVIATYEDLQNANRAAEFTEVYDFIIGDLTVAKNGLPTGRSDSDYRPTVVTARALLANVYLHQGGFPVKDAGAYAKAATEAKFVMDNGGFFLEDYADLFGSHAGAVAGVAPINKDAGNTEAIIAFQMDSWAGWGLGNFLGLQTAQWGDKLPEVNFFENFPEGARKDATYLWQIEGKDGTMENYINFKKEGVGGGNLDGIVFAGDANFPIDRPVFQKWGPWAGTAWGQFAYDVTYLRYAELLLIYAEAEIRSGGNVANAAAALNKVRVRAGLAEIATPTAAQVVQERAWETAGEFSRWHDLVRLEMIVEANAARSSKDVPITGTIDESNPWAPYPITEGIIVE